MVHQLIFANPKPGMTVEEFQDYWVNVHAVKYASKIKQIKRYMIDTTMPFMGEAPLYKGIAEIWLKAEEQIPSLQSPEFLQGARLDEPNWAAFWETIVVDSNPHVLLEGAPLTPDPTWVKLIVLNKRKSGMTLQAFRNYSLQVHAPQVLQLPGLRRYLQCHTVDGAYVLGEARFDCVWQLWFDDVQAIEHALASQQYQEVIKPDWDNFVETKYIFSMVGQEHWVIGPEAR
ncbi:MAG: EthD domain-containing protein [Ardenticatenaceae bacterium]